MAIDSGFALSGNDKFCPDVAFLQRHWSNFDFQNTNARFRVKGEKKLLKI
jgi:hypothetical protein